MSWCGCGAIARPGIVTRQPTRRRPTLSNWTPQRPKLISAGIPCCRLAQALEWIVEWYKGFQTGKDLRHLTRTQIERYEALSGDESSPWRIPPRRGADR